MIEKVQYSNFKALRAVTVGLERLTVIAGPNSCGKTSLLQGLDILASLAGTKAARSVFVGSRSPELLMSYRTRELGLKLWLSPSRARRLDGLGIRVTQTEGDEDKGRWRFIRLVLKERRWLSLMSAQALRRHVTTTFLRLEPRKLSEPSSQSPTRVLAGDGSGLAALLTTMSLTAPDEFERLQEAVRTVVPNFRRLRFETTTWNETQTQFVDAAEPDLLREVLVSRSGYRLILDTQSAPGISAEGASEGTLLAIGLLAAVMSPGRPRLILLDNIESGLHPRALGELVGHLRKILERYPELQIVASTHSPYLLDHFKPEEIRLMCSDSDGFAICGPLTDHPKFERWKDEMAPGEFWSMIGENWLLPKTVKRRAPRKAAKKK